MTEIVTDIVVPRIVQTGRADTSLIADLTPIPPRAVNEFGTSVPGCTQFPETWPTSLADERAHDCAAIAADLWWRRVRGHRLNYREYDDGVGLLVLTRDTADGRVVIGRFPHAFMACTSTSSTVGRAYRGIKDDVGAAAKETGDKLTTSFASAGGHIWNAGWVPEALVWLLGVTIDFGLEIPESTYLSLHLAASAGVFDSCHPDMRPDDPESWIAQWWACDHPRTWGLIDLDPPPATIDVDRSRAPADVVDAAKRWAAVAVPQLSSAISVEQSDDKTVALRFGGHGASAVLGPNTVAVENTSDPRSDIAGRLLRIAVTTSPGDIDGDPTAVLHRVFDVFNLRRLVAVPGPL